MMRGSKCVVTNSPMAWILVSCCILISHRGFSQEMAGRTTQATILRHLTVFEERGQYCAWPSIARSAAGDLVVVFTRSEEHLGPDGAILATRSTDNGTTWQPPTVIVDSPIDDRESGITVLRDGRMIGHFWSTRHTREFYAALPPGAYEPEVIMRWIRFVEQPEYRNDEGIAGAWSAVSSDGGRTWSRLVRGHDSVHGGIQLSDGSLLLASYRRLRDNIAILAAQSYDSSWNQIAIVSTPRPDSLSFGEPHLLQLPSGRVIVMIRATTRPYDDQDARCVLWESYSDDGGKTWVRPFATLLWGFPPHLLLLSDGRVLCTYGYRRAPFGQRACLSEDGVTWNPRDEVILRDDAPNPDLGYPASVEVEPGVVMTVYYQPNVPVGTLQRMHPPDPNRVKPGILGTLWRVPPRRQHGP